LNSLAGDGSVWRIEWGPINNNQDVCTPVRFPNFPDKSVQVVGNAARIDAASVAIHGSNDGGGQYAALNDPTGTVIAITTAAIKAVLENTEYIKPVITGGNTAVMNFNIAMIVRLSNPLRT
jgi:hypothetical protein